MQVLISFVWHKNLFCSLQWGALVLNNFDALSNNLMGAAQKCLKFCSNALNAEFSKIKSSFFGNNCNEYNALVKNDQIFCKS